MRLLRRRRSPCSPAALAARLAARARARRARPRGRRRRGHPVASTRVDRRARRRHVRGPGDDRLHFGGVGPPRHLPVHPVDVSDYARDKDHERVTTISDVKVSSPTGAPAQIKSESDRRRAGHPDRRPGPHRVRHRDLRHRLRRPRRDELRSPTTTSCTGTSPATAGTHRSCGHARAVVAARPRPTDTVCFEGRARVEPACACDRRPRRRRPASAVRFVADPLGRRTRA